MKHVNAKYLNALAQGKTIQYRYADHHQIGDEWSNLQMTGYMNLNSTASAFLVTGKQSPDYEILLRIKPDQE